MTLFPRPQSTGTRKHVVRLVEGDFRRNKRQSCGSEWTANLWDLLLMRTGNN